VSKVLAGGMGGRPMMMFAQNGVEVIAGCPELPIKEVLEKYMANSLETGTNACGGEGYDHAHCHHHG
jgi:predicted Fe-Mo cluster-binding NifX family protein